MELEITQPKDMPELKELVKTIETIPENFYVAVESSVFDKDNHWILMRRGPGCKDNRFKLEGIGGGIESGDKTFIDALKREIREEAGNKAEISIQKFLYARVENVFDLHEKIDKTWIILSYIAVLEKGELQIMEKNKNLGFEKYHLDEIDENDLTQCAKSTYKKLKFQWEQIKEEIK